MCSSDLPLAPLLICETASNPSPAHSSRERGHAGAAATPASAHGLALVQSVARLRYVEYVSRHSSASRLAFRLSWKSITGTISKVYAGKVRTNACKACTSSVSRNA